MSDIQFEWDSAKASAKLRKHGVAFEEGNAVVVRRSGRNTSAEIHRAVFGHENLPPRSIAELKEGIRKHVRVRHARD